MKQVFRSRIHGAHYSTRLDLYGHYAAIIAELSDAWNMSRDKWASWLDVYRYFRILTKQREYVVGLLGRETTWEGLEARINENMVRIFAYPLAILENDALAHRHATDIAFIGGEITDISGTAYINTMERQFYGDGYLMTARVNIEQNGKKRFRPTDLISAFGSIGIHVHNIDYQPAQDVKGEHVEAHYSVELGFLKSEWPNLEIPEEVITHDDDDLTGIDDYSYLDDDQDDDLNSKPNEVIESYKKIIY